MKTTGAVRVRSLKQKAPPLAALHPSSRLTLQHADEHLDHTVLTEKKK